MEKPRSSEFVISRRHRTRYTSQQVATLERAFEENQYPDSIQMEKLGMDLTITSDRIAIWFQNRRSKFKRTNQSDHMMWMRKQIFQHDLDLMKAPQLPVFTPSCHVLSPLEPQITRREYPAEMHQSPPTPVYTVQRQTYEASQRVQSPYHPFASFAVYDSDSNVSHPDAESRHNHDSSKENREPVFRNSPVNIPSVPTIPSMYNYGRVPFHKVLPGSSLNQTVTPVSRYPTHVPDHSLRENQSTPKSFPVHLNYQDHQQSGRGMTLPSSHGHVKTENSHSYHDTSTPPSFSVYQSNQIHQQTIRSLASHGQVKTSANSQSYISPPTTFSVYQKDPNHQQSIRRLPSLVSQGHMKTENQPSYHGEKSVSPVRPSVESVLPDLFIYPFNESESPEWEQRDRELSDMLLKQKALECLAQWC